MTTTHDGEACRRAGIRFIGLTCGGHDAGALEDAGAWVWVDPAALLAELDRLLETP
jgi:phosphoglycolate phosphatase-like HAD superfamily hydrolase